MNGVKEELARRASNLKERETGIVTENNDDMQEKNVKRRHIRLLRADEIECRVSIIKGNGLSLLLFKDARVDQKILDETFTPFGWKRTHQIIDGNLYCTVEIWDEEKQQWIAKQDVGTTSYSEKEKGQASDSFKRACFNWGVGRELYTAPFIWIPAENTHIQQKGDRYMTSDRFSVQSIAYNEQREIAELTIINGRGIPVYMFGQNQRYGQGMNMNQNTNMNSNTRSETEDQQAKGAELQMSVLEKELKRTGVTLDTVLARYQIQNLEQMTPEIYAKALNGLKKSKSRAA